jgi:protein TonB
MANARKSARTGRDAIKRARGMSKDRRARELSGPRGVESHENEKSPGGTMMTRERAFGWLTSVALQVLALGALGVSPLLNYDGLPEPQNVIPPRNYVRIIETPTAHVDERRAPGPARSKPDAARIFEDLVAPTDVSDRILDDAELFRESAEGVPFGIFESTGDAPAVEIREPQDPPELVPIGGNVTAPRKRHHVNPAYPPVAAAARVQGTVVLEATIDENGNVVNLRVLRSIPLLDGVALEAVRQWTYEPTLLNGRPVPILMSVSVRFELGR